MFERAFSSSDLILQPIRPMLHFGQRMTVGLSTAVSFDPETVIKAATGHSLTYYLKEMDYAGYLALQAWTRSAVQGSTMRQTTRASLSKLSAPVGDLNRPPSLDELKSLPPALANDWRLLFRTFRRGTGPTWRKIIVRLAARNRECYALQRMGDERKVAAQRDLLQPSLDHWGANGVFAGSHRPILVLDKTLEHLAWVDIKLSQSKHTVLATDPVVGLLKPGKVPMRHWFDRILHLTGTPNLAALCDLLAERARYDRGRAITHVELKQWATASKRLTASTAYQLLDACQPSVDLHRERVQLWIASLLTFLVSFVQAFAKEPIARHDAQVAIYERLVSLRGLPPAGA